MKSLLTDLRRYPNGKVILSLLLVGSLLFVSALVNTALLLMRS